MMIRDHTTTRLPSLVPLLLGLMITLSISLSLFTGVTGQTFSDDVDNDNGNNTVVYDVLIIGAGWSGKKGKEKKRTWCIGTPLLLSKCSNMIPLFLSLLLLLLLLLLLIMIMIIIYIYNYI